MDSKTRDQLQAFIEASIASQQRLQEALEATPKVPAARLEAAREALEALIKVQFLPSGTTNGWATRSQQLRPWVAEWADEPPYQLSYTDVAALVGLTEGSIRVRISQSHHKGFVRYIRGHHVAVLRHPEDLAKVLNERFLQTQNPDDRYTLSPRPAKTR